MQTGVRIEAGVLNVLKALAALKGITLGDLIEGIVLHAFEGQVAFSEETLGQIRDLKKVYGLKLKASDSHLLVEKPTAARSSTKKTKSLKRS